MSEVKFIQLPDGSTLYVEMATAELPVVPAQQASISAGATDRELVGFAVDAIKAIDIFKNNIRGLSKAVQESFANNQPEEWSLEMNIGFKGTTSPIPVILSGEASGGIKVTAKWKKAPHESPAQSGG